MTIKCENCKINTNYHTREEFEFFTNIPEHHKFLKPNELRKDPDGSYWNKSIINPYCLDCTKHIKAYEIERTGGFILELDTLIKRIDYHENGNFKELINIGELLKEQNKKLDFLNDLVKKIDHLESKFTELQTQLKTTQINQ